MFDNLLGGLGEIFGLDQSKRADAKNRKFQWKVLQEQLKYQREFAQHGMRWRVEDAKAAGLHPLSVLGAQGLPSYSPVSVDSTPSATATAIGRGFGARFQTRLERAAQLAALEESKSRVATNAAEAAYYNAMAAKEMQSRVSEPEFPEVNTQGLPMPEIPASAFEYSDTAGGAELVAPKVNFSRPGSGGGIVAGPANPSLREFKLPGGLPIMLPDANSLGEALEPISESWALGFFILKENARYYGAEWKKQMLKRFGPDWLNTLLGMNRKNVFRRATPVKRGPNQMRKRESRF